MDSGDGWTDEGRYIIIHDQILHIFNKNNIFIEKVNSRNLYVSSFCN